MPDHSPHIASLRETARKHQRYFLYETNVGAGLPIIQTLRQARRNAGDEIIKIEGVFSVLSYIFNSRSAGGVISEVVRERIR